MSRPMTSSLAARLRSSPVHPRRLTSPSIASWLSRRLPPSSQSSPSSSPISSAAASRGLVPIVIQREDRAERSFDIFSRLLRERIVFVSGEINDDDANVVVAQLLFLEAEAPESPIHLYINSPGGSVTAGLAIYDALVFVTSPVHTLCLGQASSMASILLAAGSRGHRRSLPNASIMIHQPSGGAAGQASDIAIRANEILRVRAKLVDIYQRHCGLEGESVDDGRARFEKALDRDYYLTAEEARSFGIVDDVVTSRKSSTPPPSQP